jgi:hypothetical protein
MGWRDKVLAGAQQYLEPGEQVRAVGLGQSGPSPWVTALIGWLVMFAFAKFRVIVVTDRAIVLLDASGWSPAKARGVVGRYPLQSFADLKGLWGKTNVGDNKLWVHKRFQKELKAAA